MESDRSTHHHFHHFHTLPPDVSVSATNTSLDFSLKYRGIPKGATPAPSFTGPLSICEECKSKDKHWNPPPTSTPPPPTHAPMAVPKTNTPLAEDTIDPSGTTEQLPDICEDCKLKLPIFCEDCLPKIMHWNTEQQPNLCEDCKSRMIAWDPPPTPTSSSPTHGHMAEPKTDTPLAEDPMDLSGTTGQPPQARGSQKDPAKGEDGLPSTQERHAAYEVATGADVRLLQAARVRPTTILLILATLYILPTFATTTTSEVVRGVFMVEGRHYPLQIRSLTERFSLKVLTSAAHTIEKLEEMSSSFREPSVHPLLNAWAACPHFGGQQALSDPILMQKKAYHPDGARYSAFIHLRFEGTSHEPPLLAWTVPVPARTGEMLNCAYTIAPRLTYDGHMAPPNYHYAEQSEMFTYYRNILRRTCSKSDIKKGTLKRNSRKVTLPHKGSTNLFICQQLCVAAHLRAQLQTRTRGNSSCLGANCWAAPDPGCDHWSYNFADTEACYIYNGREIKKGDLAIDWGDHSIKGITAARDCSHPELMGDAFMGGRNGNEINVRQFCHFELEVPDIEVHVTCGTTADSMTAWLEVLKTQMQEVYQSLEGWSPISRHPTPQASKTHPSRAVSSLITSPSITTFMGKTIMTAARATQAIPMLGPIISGGLLLASTILPTALHLCLESWSDPQRRVVDTGFNQGGQERNYWGDGESTWEQFQETNLLNLQLENNSKIDPADITEVIKTATIEVRKAVTEVRNLLKKTSPAIKSNRELLNQRGKFTFITTIDGDFSHMSRIYFYLDVAQPATSYRTAILMSLDQSLPLIEGRAINPPDTSTPGKVLVECYDQLRSKGELPSKCFDTSRTGAARTLATSFINDSLIVKVLGEGQIQLQCPARSAVYYTMGAFVAQISETCTILGDGGLVVYEPPRSSKTSGATGDFSILWESQTITSDFEPSIQPRLKRGIEKIVQEVVTMTDLITYLLAAITTVAAIATAALHFNLKRVNQVLQATTQRSEAELKMLVKDTQRPHPRNPPAIPLRKTPTYEPLVLDSTPPEPIYHEAIKKPHWKGALSGAPLPPPHRV